MARGRMIASDIFIDDFVGGLSHFERLVWIGLIASVADDQGRMMDNPALIKSVVFLYDTIQDSEVEKAIQKITAACKVARYIAGNKHLIQIVNWWKYQTPSWASPSKYPAPDKWTDREKYHAPGNKIVMLNWDKIGGYVVDYVPPVDSPLNESEGERKGEEESAPEISIYEQWLDEITGLPADSNEFETIKSFEEMKPIKEDMQDGYKWLKGHSKVIKYRNQLVNPTHTAMAIRLGKIHTGEPAKLTEEELRRSINV